MTPDMARRVRLDVQALWQLRRREVLSRVDALAAAVGANGSAASGGAARRAAEREAHRLAGSLGTFGFTAAPGIARQLERELAGTAALNGPAATRVDELLRALRAELERPEPTEPVVELDAPPRRPFVLIVGAAADAAVSSLRAAATPRLRIEAVDDVAAAEPVVDDQPPDAVVVVPSDAGDWPAMAGFVAHLARQPRPTPVLVVATTVSGADRISMVRAGARAVLPRTASSAKVVGLLESLLDREPAGPDRLLVVDDDPVFLALVETLLAPHPLHLTTLEGPERFWWTLEEAAPDLVLLNLDMPHATGVDLCRALRTEPRWAGLPVLLLTSDNDPATVEEAFSAGADDYVVKPVVGPELVTRITNRLERVRLYRQHADTDPLTGLCNRRQFGEELSRLMRIGLRHGEPLSFVMLDVDEFKRINDQYGHVTGDETLQRLAARLVADFRGEDVVGRWGGEEFALGLFGMSRADGVARVADALESLRAEPFLAPDGSRMAVTFSAGVAQYPDDGADLHALYRAADAALFAAKSAGRDQVRPAASPVGVS